VLISRVSALHLAPTENAVVNLLGEGVAEERIQFVGSTMAESVLRNLDAIKNSSPALEYGVIPDGYVLAAFHGPENLTVPGRMNAIADAMTRLGLPVLVPDARDLCDGIIAAGTFVPPDLYCLDPVPYLDMLALQRAVITDSGGIQEEACMLGTPCVTVRSHTEHDATIEVEANRLVRADSDAIVDAVGIARAGSRSWVAPKRWDRAVSDRIVRAFKRGVIPLG
jgi:UDP-N-acetylglucosamine 2-epimerase